MKAGIASFHVSQRRWQKMAPIDVPRSANAPIGPRAELCIQIASAPKSSTSPTKNMVLRFSPYFWNMPNWVSNMNFCQPQILIELAKRKSADRRKIAAMCIMLTLAQRDLHVFDFVDDFAVGFDDAVCDAHGQAAGLDGFGEVDFIGQYFAVGAHHAF